MTFIEIIDAFTFYGFDIIALAALTAGVTQIIKVTLLKKANKKLCTFLPFILGTLFYAVYAAVRNLSFYYIICNYVSIVEHGISVGGAATLAYVLYEQFVREKSGLTAAQKIIYTLTEGYIPEDKLEEAAREISNALERDVIGNGAAKAAEIITAYSDGELTEAGAAMLVKLIIQTISRTTSSMP